MKDGKIPDDFFKDKIDYCGLEDNIYNQLSKTMARAVDIDFAKTPVVDILTGYTRYIEAEKRVEQLESIRKEAIEYIENNTKYYDADYSETYRELCSMPGANDTRLHVVVGDTELLNILNKEENLH